MDTEDQKIFELLQARLYRNQCPSALDLGEYALGLSEQDVAQKLRMHLLNCPHCRREMTTFEQDLELNKGDDSWLNRLRIWFATPLLPDSVEPVYALRGESDEPQIFSADNGIQIAINIQPDSEHIGYFSIVGMIIGAEAAKYTIDIWHDGALQNQTAANDLGNFHLNHLSPGSYELIVTGPDFLLHIQTLNIT